MNPIVSPRLDVTGSLTFENAAVAAGFAAPPAAYRATWSQFDNATGATTRIAESQSATTTIAASRDLPSAPGSFVEIDIAAESAEHPTWQQPVRTHFRRDAGGWKLVGLERLPGRAAGAGAGVPATGEGR